MKKIFSLILILLFVFCSSFQVSAITLKGRITFQSKEVKDALANVDEVRKEAFANVQNSIDISPHQKHFNDPFHRMNKSFAKKKVSYTLGDFSRFITHFSDGGYCISYDNSDITYYYNKKGKLKFIEYDDNSDVAPRYDISGKLSSVSISKNKVEYIFNTNGDLISFWINSIAYSPN